MLLDQFQRPLRNLRLSVTDRCNLRCQYCMPEEEYVWLPREDILHFEEIDRLVDQFLSLGVDKVRLTGGEPLLRRDLPSLIEQLSRKPAIRDLAMTTNAVLLAPLVHDVKNAGLHRLTISLDTLQRDRFVSLARFDELPRVLAGIDAAVDVFPGFKIDSVMIAPPSRPARSRPAAVTMGVRPARRACLPMTVRSGSPLARAVRM